MVLRELVFLLYGLKLRAHIKTEIISKMICQFFSVFDIAKWDKAIKEYSRFISVLAVFWIGLYEWNGMLKESMRIFSVRFSKKGFTCSIIVYCLPVGFRVDVFQTSSEIAGRHFVVLMYHVEFGYYLMRQISDKSFFRQFSQSFHDGTGFMLITGCKGRRIQQNCSEAGHRVWLIHLCFPLDCSPSMQVG